MELEFRKEQEKYKNYDEPYKNIENATMPKTIAEIRNFIVYGPTGFSTCYNLLLTSKDGKFNLRWVKIAFIEKDKFKLTTEPISIIEPTIDDVIQFSDNQSLSRKLDISRN